MDFASLATIWRNLPEGIPSQKMETPPHILNLVHALAQCKDVDDSALERICLLLWNSPTASLIMADYALTGYCDSDMAEKECRRIIAAIGSRQR